MENNLTASEFKQLFGDISVKAESVADFLERYYKPERYTGRGAEYAKYFLEVNEREFGTLGYAHISKFDSVTGKHVAYFAKDLTK